MAERAEPSPMKNNSPASRLSLYAVTCLIARGSGLWWRVTYLLRIPDRGVNGYLTDIFRIRTISTHKIMVKDRNDLGPRQ